MFAVIRSGGTQHKVSSGDVVKFAKIPGQVGDNVEFNNLVCIGEGGKVTVGDKLKKYVVSAEILEQKRDSKVIVLKKKRRKGYKRKLGHSRQVTYCLIESIKAM